MTGHVCDPNEGFDRTLRTLGVNPAQIDLNRLPPPKCPHRLTQPADDPATPTQRIARRHGPCRHCGLEVVTWKGAPGLGHLVPSEPADTRPARWAAAALHPPAPGETA